MARDALPEQETDDANAQSPGRRATTPTASDEASHLPPREVFACLEKGEWRRFVEHLDPDVQWVVMGSHLFAGTYQGREAVRRARFLPILQGLEEGTEVEILALHEAGDVIVIELLTKPPSSGGVPCSMAYCWIVRFRHGTIVEVHAYPDPAMIQHLMRQQG